MLPLTLLPVCHPLPARQQRVCALLSVYVGLAAVLTQAGCGPPYAFEPWEPRAYPASGKMRGKHAALRVFYATDRNRNALNTGVADYYGNERNGGLQYGACQVSIPQGHGRGRMEAPALLSRWDPDWHVAATEVKPAADGLAFASQLREAVARSPRKQALVFVHGYCVTFEDAIRRTAQIAHDTDFDGVPIAYCWPAQGFLVSYLVDATNIEWTEPHLVDFLSLLVDASAAERVHLLAHSMGNRVLVRAVREMVRDRDARARSRESAAAAPPPFDQIVLAAGDMDAEIFARDYAPYIVRAANRATIYISANDWAIAGSHRLHRYARLGETAEPLNGTRRLPNIDVVDATAVDKGIVGHFYYGDSPSVLEDLQHVWLGTPAAQRSNLKANGGFLEILPRGRSSLATATGAGSK